MPRRRAAQSALVAGRGDGAWLRAHELGSDFEGWTESYLGVLRGVRDCFVVL
jgi:hypothetical protein